MCMPMLRRLSVNALYSVFNPAIRVPGEIPDMCAQAERSGTGTAPFGSTPRTRVLAKGLDVIAGFIDELEAEGEVNVLRPLP